MVEMVVRRSPNPVMSPDGFPPLVWGPALWRVMHIMAFNYPLAPTRTHVTAYYQWFKSLCVMLPCRRCREEFCALVENPQSPLVLRKGTFTQRGIEGVGAARHRVIKYTLDLHAAVNARLRKRFPTDARYWVRHYTRLRTRRAVPAVSKR